MDKVELIQKESDMALVRSPRSFALIRQQYEAIDSGENKVLVSYFLRPSQKRLIDGLAAHTGRGKAEVIREIIDEWCLLQLDREEDGGQ